MRHLFRLFFVHKRFESSDLLLVCSHLFVITLIITVTFCFCVHIFLITSILFWCLRIRTGRPVQWFSRAVQFSYQFMSDWHTLPSTWVRAFEYLSESWASRLHIVALSGRHGCALHLSKRFVHSWVDLNPLFSLSITTCSCPSNVFRPLLFSIIWFILLKKEHFLPS